MTESEIQAQIRLALNSGDVRTFRNHTGAVKCARTGHFHRFGIPSSGGGSDLIGFKTVTITPDMVGQRVALFVAIEVKTDSGRISPAQQTFIDFVLSRGGIAGIARTLSDAKKIIS